MSKLSRGQKAAQTRRENAAASKAAVPVAAKIVPATEVAETSAPVLDFSHYEPVKEAQQVVAVKTKVGNELTDDYMSLAAVSNFVRKKPTHVQELVDDIAKKTTINRDLMHRCINVGDAWVAAFFLTEKESARTRFSVKQYLNILVRVAKSKYTIEDVEKMKRLTFNNEAGEKINVRYLHQVPAEVIKTFVGK